MGRFPHSSVSLRGLDHLLESNHEVFELEGTLGHQHPPLTSPALIHPLTVARQAPAGLSDYIMSLLKNRQCGPHA